MLKPSFPTQPTYQTTTSINSEIPFFIFLPLWIKKLHLMPVQINPVLLFSINFCILTFCQESFLSALLLQPQNDIISEDNDSNQNKTNKNTTFPSQHQTQYTV